MADKVIKIDIDVDSKSLGQLESELEQINAELKEVEIGSDAFEKLSKDAQKLTGQIEKVNQKIEGFTMDKKIQAADGAIKVFGGSIASVVGTLGLLGVESEVFGEMEKYATSAISLAIGLKDVSEGYKNMRTALQGVTVAQIKANAAALANPYVAVAAAVAGLTVAFAKYSSSLTDDVVPWTTSLKNMFFSLGDGTKYARLQAEAYAKALEKQTLEKTISDLDRAIQVTQAFGEETINMQIDKAEKELKLLEEGSKEYEDKLTEILVLRAQRSKEEGEKQAEAYENARQKRLEELQFKWAAEEFANDMWEELAADDGKEAAEAFMRMFNKTAKEEFDPNSILYFDTDELEIEEDLFGEDGVITNFRKGLQDALDQTIKNRDNWDNFLNLATEAFNTVTDLSQQRFDRQMRNLERERSEIETNTNLSEQQRTEALARVEAKEKEAELRRIKAERDQFTLQQTLLIAEEVMKTKFFVQEQIRIAKIAQANGTATAQQLALSAAVAQGEAGMSIGAFTKALGPFGIAAFALSIGGIIATIVSARKKAQQQISALGVSSSGGSSAGVSLPSLPSARQINEPAQAPQAPAFTPTVRAYVVSGDITSSQEAEAKLNNRRAVGA